MSVVSLLTDRAPLTKAGAGLSANPIPRGIGGTGLWNAGGFVYEPLLTSRYQGDSGRRLFATMAARDTTVRSMLLAIKLPIRTVLWHMQPASDDEAGKAAAEFGESLIAEMATPWGDALSEILTEIEFGWSAMEIVLKKRDDGKIGLGDLQPRAQDTLYKWDFDDAGNVTAMHQQLAGSEAVIPAERLALFRTEANKNSPEGRSMLLSSADTYRELRHIVQHEVIGVDRDLTGVPVLYAPSAAMADPAIKVTLEKIVRDLKFNDQSGVVLPSDPITDSEGKPSTQAHYRLELISAPGRRSMDTDKIITRKQTDMVRSILADFLMLGLASKGSYALSRDKSEMFEKSLAAIVDPIEEQFDRSIMRPIWVMNGLPIETKPRWKAGRLNEANIEALGEFLKNLEAAGFAVANDEREEALMEMAGVPIGTLGSDAKARAEMEGQDLGNPPPSSAPERKPGSATPDKGSLPAGTKERRGRRL